MCVKMWMQCCGTTVNVVEVMAVECLSELKLQGQEATKGSRYGDEPGGVGYFVFGREEWRCCAAIGTEVAEWFRLYLSWQLS
ncbi:hypothetical protein C5167_033094 [Papaver somniferum]|uniref:Uncharacterized protein n=1 Tax=Papaver somniferum TaxID=3469 RepID=A0A4Y7KDC9_PAPSO|nr:hypothetical protein C5167_033094 [Papaver somniferum]